MIKHGTTSQSSTSSINIMYFVTFTSRHSESLLYKTSVTVGGIKDPGVSSQFIGGERGLTAVEYI